MRRHPRLQGVIILRIEVIRLKLKTKNKFLKLIILFLLIVMLLDKIKDAFSIIEKIMR